jgi:hypothetical protein
LITKAALAIGTMLLTTAAQRPPEIPAEYQGSWSMDLAYCNFEGDTLDNELYVTSNTVGFHAELHRVKTVKLRKGKVLVSYFKMSDATRVAPKELLLSKDKSMLNDSWHRCPTAAES